MKTYLHSIFACIWGVIVVFAVAKLSQKLQKKMKYTLFMQYIVSCVLMVFEIINQKGVYI